MADICTKTRLFNRGFLGKKDAFVITSDFGVRRKPNQKEFGFHYGVDLRAATGTEIYCPVDSAKIVSAGIGVKSGLTVCIEYNNGNSVFYIWFMHLHTKQYSNADKGKEIKLGDLIGTTGGDPNVDPKSLTGKYSTGPHLHLEIRKNCNQSAFAVDPKIFFLAKHTLSIKGAVVPLYTGNGYVSGVNAMYSGDTALYFCEESLIAANQARNNGIENLDIEVKTDSNNETEYNEGTKTQWSEAKERLALGIWQITKLVMDSSVEKKQLCDSSIAIQTGSLLNFFNKVCQQPFVEFSGDTFGNQYYWLVRRPPFDREGFLRMLDTATQIDGVDIISMQTQYEVNNIYSWYRIVPIGDILGVSEETYLSPAVFFPEYAQIWGSKPLDVQSNYYNYMFSGHFNKDKNQQKWQNDKRIAQNVVADFKFLIESNAYRPFSKSGSVTIKGCRKIKRGTLVQFEDGQVFHVDSVSHSYNITSGGVSNTTTLQLSHGIYANFIKTQKTENFGDVSYFDLIDWGDNFDINNVDGENFQDVISQWHVRTDCLIFFLNKFHESGGLIKI